MQSKIPTPKLAELSTELDELKNPTDRPPTGTPREAVQIIDRSRLLAGWESNVNTMRGVLRQLAIAERTNLLTRILMLASVLFNILLLSFVMVQLDQITQKVVNLELTIVEHRKLESEPPPGP